MENYNRAFSRYLDIRTAFWLGQATYEEAYAAKQEYLKLKHQIYNL